MLAKLREQVLGQKRLLLVYHVGRARSHLLVLGDRAFSPEAFSLTVQPPRSTGSGARSTALSRGAVGSAP